MLAKSNPVTGVYRDGMFAYITNLLRCCKLHHVTADIHRIDSGAQRRIYLTFDGGKPCAWLFLHRRKGWRAWEVWQSWCSPEHRQKGIGTRLYQAAINVDNLLLSSGAIHSKYSRAVWKSFVKRGLFNIWAHDFKSLTSTALVAYDKDEDALDCDLDIYDFRTSYEDYFHKRRPTDVRLLATRNTP